jgi:predicted glycoside hydrolase/deacetylase ChbG (UPF0249 family)
LSPEREAVVINADDFGISAPVNCAIVECFRRGWITSASIMANMPGFDEACALIRERGLVDRVGLHLVANEGPALTPDIRRWPRLCRPDGTLGGDGTLFRLERDEARDLEAELAAQVEAARSRGILPTHFDSHGHFHTQWPVATIVIRLARRLGVPAVRLTRNCGPGIPIAKRIYKSALNARLARVGLAKTRYFGSAADVESLPRHARGAVEIMVHPGLDPSGGVIDLSPEPRVLSEVAARWGATHRPTSYAGLTGETPAP